MKFPRSLRSALALVQWSLYGANALVNFLGLPFLRKTVFKQDFKKIWRDGQRFGLWARLIFGIHVEVESRPHGGLPEQFIIVANHRSWFDQLILGEFIPTPWHVFAKESYFKMPLFGAGWKLFECIPVTKEKLAAEQKELARRRSDRVINRMIDDGDSFLFFPEGTRGSGRNLLPFKHGAFRMAARTGLPLVPIYLIGTEEILSKSKSLLAVKSGTVRMWIDQPIYFNQARWLDEMAEFERSYRLKFSQLLDGAELSGPI